jgi:hypothetical protein
MSGAPRRDGDSYGPTWGRESRGHSVALNVDSTLSTSPPMPTITAWDLAVLGALLLVMTAMSLRQVSILFA